MVGAFLVLGRSVYVLNSCHHAVHTNTIFTANEGLHAGTQQLALTVSLKLRAHDGEFEQCSTRVYGRFWILFLF